MRGPQHSILAIANDNQDIETALKQDKSEGAMAPLGPIVAAPMCIPVSIPKVLTVNNIWLFSSVLNLHFKDNTVCVIEHISFNSVYIGN